MNGISALNPGRKPKEINQILQDNHVTAEEVAEFRRYFPNGLLGGITFPEENDRALEP